LCGFGFRAALPQEVNAGGRVSDAPAANAL
jgi:hypothetical protein